MARSGWRDRQWRRRWYKRVVLLVLSTVLVLAGVVVTRAFVLRRAPGVPKVLRGAPSAGVADGKRMERALRLAGAISIPTVSHEGGLQDTSGLLQLHRYLLLSFPLVHNSTFIQREVVNTYSLLYTVTGSDDNDTLPYLLCAHMDVVPADPATWEVDPFTAGVVNNTYIYGRGTIDHKGGVMGILEALEYMLGQGERPRRSFYIAFGHDEELAGTHGAQELAKALRARGVKKVDFLLDEGFPILKGVLPGTSKPIAVVGVAEKGVVTVKLSVTMPPGHSSFPPRESAIGILAKAVVRLEDFPQPSMFGTGPESALFEHIAPDMSFGFRALFSNLWLFSDLLVAVMERDPKLNAMVRTTTAVTIMNGGHKDNVVPGSATVVVNHRIHPSQSVADVLEHDRQVIDDPRVSLTPMRQSEALPASPYGPSDLPYQLLAATVHQTFKDTLVAPSVLIANTDTRWYQSFTRHVFRFFPTVMGPSDTARYHGNNERISVEDYHHIVDFYYRFIKNADLLVGYVHTVHTNEEL